MLAERLADVDALGGEEGIGHAAADDEGVDPVDQVAEQLELGRDLGAAHHRDHRAFRVARAPSRAPRARPASAARRRTAAAARGPRSRRARGAPPRRRRCNRRRRAPPAPRRRPDRSPPRPCGSGCSPAAAPRPPASAATALAATSPTQSSAKATGRPSAASSAGSATRRLISGTTLPFGRSKCASSTGLPPLARISLIVGTIRSIRVASVTSPVLDRHVDVDPGQHDLARQVHVVERLPGHRASPVALRRGRLRAAPRPLRRPPPR